MPCNFCEKCGLYPRVNVQYEISLFEDKGSTEKLVQGGNVPEKVVHKFCMKPS